MSAISRMATLFLQKLRNKATTNWKIFAALLVVGSLTAIVKLITAIKDIIVARQFGVSDDVDAFCVAILLPLFAVNVLTDTFGRTLIPSFIQLQETKGKKSAQELFSNATLLCIILLIAVSGVLWFTFPFFVHVIASKASPQKLSTILRLFYIVVPVILLTGISTMWSALLNACRSFLLISVSPIIQPLAIALMLIVCNSMGNVRVDILAYGMVGGALVEMAIVGFAVRRYGFTLTPKWSGLSSSLRSMLQQYAPLVAGAVIMSGSTVVDQSLASTLGSGNVSALSYGNKIVAFANGIVTLALTKSMMPYFSTLVAQQDWKGIKRTLRVYMPLVFGVMTLVTVGMVIMSEPLVRVLFEHGKFSASDTVLVASIQRFYALQMPFFTTTTLTVTLLAALKNCQVFLWFGIVNLTMNIVLDILFMRWFGVRGIALSTSCVYICSFTFSLVVLMRKLPSQRTENDLGGKL